MSRFIKRYFKLINEYIKKNKLISFKYYKKYFSKKKLIEILNELKEDFNFYLKSDPSIKEENEVLELCSFKSICIYRLAHVFYTNKDYYNARKLSEYAHSKYGVDIHPGALIKSPFFMDHGTGVVIGETTIIKENVKIFHSVTLGAKEFSLSKRHPTIGSNVVIYCHAAIFGDVEIVKNSIVKAYSVIK